MMSETEVMTSVQVDSDSSLLHPPWAKLVAGFRELDQVMKGRREQS